MTAGHGTDAIEDVLPLTPLQATMLLASLRAPQAGVFVQQQVLRLPEGIEARAWRAAWQSLVQRTPALRVSFHWRDLEQPVQAVHHEVALPFEDIDARALDDDAFAARLDEHLSAGRQAGFDLEQAPLMRLALLHAHDGSDTFVWQFHHILFDGWSAQMLVGEVIAHYQALGRGVPFRPTARPPLRRYIDWLAQRDLGIARRHWRAVLRGFDAPVRPALPLPHGPSGPSGADEEHGLVIDATTTQALQTLAREHALTLNTLVQGAWALLLACYADRDDIVFGTVVAGRPPEVDGIEQMIGLFINAVPVRARPQPDAALVPWLQDLQAAQAAGGGLHYLSAAELQRCSELPAGTPLFETLLVFENFPNAASAGPSAAIGLDLARADVPLSVLVVPGCELRLAIRHDASRYRRADIVAMAGHLGQLLRSMAGSPFTRLADLSPLDGDERRLLAATQQAGPARTALDPAALLRHWAHERAADPAFVDGERVLGFAQLDRAARRLAVRLRRSGVARGAPVAVCLPRSLEQVIAFYAVLLAHGVYLPLDPGYPTARLQHMLDQAQPILVLGNADRLPECWAPCIAIEDWCDDAGHAGAAGDAACCDWRADDPACIVFTSGSTGRPKGVLLPWGQLANRLAWMWQAYPFAPGERACQRTALGFVDSLWELLGAPLQGVPTVIVPARMGGDAHALIARLAQGGVTRLWFVPSLLKMLLEARPDLGAALPALRFWVSSGEPLAADLAARFAAAHPAATLFNLYGTSEVWDATWFDPRREPAQPGPVPIGRPIDGVRAYVLDRRLRLQPFEVEGELCIGGAGVALGYLDPASDARIVADPHAGVPGARLYRTGDLARVQRDGLIVCLGRRDHQMKLRGVRIEPAEIEATLRTRPGVKDAVGVLRDERLIAYVAAPPGDFDAAALRHALQAVLPESHVPAQLVRVDALPMTASGKVDRGALPAPTTATLDAAVGGTAAEPAPTPLQRQVLACFQEVLQCGPPSLHANFFRDLGGHSLLALRVSSRLTRRCGVDVPAGTLFQHPSAHALAAWLEAAGAGAGEDDDAELLALLQSLPAAERERLLAGLLGEGAS